MIDYRNPVVRPLIGDYFKMFKFVQGGNFPQFDPSAVTG
jgi:hypothetical protein